MLTTKDAKKKALKELEGLKKELLKAGPRSVSVDALATYLNSLPLFKRIIYISREKGILQIYYSNMTLTIYIKSGIIQLDDKFDLWNEEETGFIGTFTSKTLQMECTGKELE